MERRIKTGSGFRAQRVVERKFPNGNPDVTDWFRLGKGGSRNFARERMENVATVGSDVNVPGTWRAESKISHPYQPPLPHFAFCFHCMLFCYCA